jgi:alginate O-acetyltransferase complex protein AlgI
MEFNTFTFAFYVVAALGVYRALPTWRTRKVFLLVASYVFYAAWDPPLILLLWSMTLVSWLLARAIGNTDRKLKSRRRALVISMLVVSLGVLSYFKYSRLLLATFADLASTVGIELSVPRTSIALPLGVSFFTFETLSYAVDIYRRATKPAKLLDYCLFVAFFPHLVAGPIIRAADLIPQFESAEGPRPKPGTFAGGLVLVLFGMFAKVVLADTFLSRVVNPAFEDLSGIGMFDAWSIAICFTGQVFFDFAGYSMIAIGTAQLFGLWLPTNFNFPFGSLGFTDFWTRWHMTLSAWIRDYLYFPLSISSLKALRSRLPRDVYNRFQFLGSVYAVMVTMFLAGLWHGASWTMALMGLTYGALLMCEHVLRKVSPNPGRRLGRLAVPVGAIVTFLAVCIPMTMFRSPDMNALTTMVGAMLGGSPELARDLSRPLVIGLLIIAATLAVHIAFREKGFVKLLDGMSPRVRVGLYAVVLALLIVCDQPDIDFIYFAF